MADRGQEPKNWEDVPPIVFSARERLKAMDVDGVDCSILYPSVSGMAAEPFGKLDDSDLEPACVQAYNDWLIDEWADVSPRFVPQCIVTDLADGAHGERNRASCDQGSQRRHLSGVPNGATQRTAHQ